MADYQIRTYTADVHGGIAPFTINPVTGWTDKTGTSGNINVSLTLVNKLRASKRQDVTTHYKPNWTISYDANNRMIVHLSGVVTSVDASVSGAGGNDNITRHLRYRNRRNGSIARDFDYHAAPTSGRLSGQFNVASYSFTVNPGATSSTNDMLWVSNWAVGYGSEGSNNVWTDNALYGVQFKNTRAWIYDSPVINSVNCAPGDASGTAVLSINTDFGATRPGAGGTVKFEFSKQSDFSTIDKTVTVSGSSRYYNASNTITGLQPNTRYYVRYTSSNGDKSATSTCNFVTLATNLLSNQAALSATSGTVKLVVTNGGGVYNPSTKVQIKKCSASAWTNHTTTATKTSITVNFNNLEPETCYQVRAITSTTAGDYTGNVVTFTTPDQHLASAEFTTIHQVFQDDQYYVQANVCYDYESEIQPITAKTYYRMKGDTEWVEADVAEFTQLTGNHCFELHDLFPNLVTYEMYIETETEDGTWRGNVKEFQTPLMENPYNYICDNLTYLLDLLCQAIEPLKTGNKKIYANPATKESCDPYSKNPTLATLWSRILRFDHAAACVICAMKEQELVNSGNEDQYFVGEVGWMTILQEVEEGADGLVSSKAVKDYLAEEVNKVWHFQESITYLVGTQAELPTTGVEENADAIVTSTSKKYVYDGTTWNEDTSFSTVNFAVFHIVEETNTSFGHVSAGSAYYYFGGTWNNLDANTKELEKAVKKMEDAIVVMKQAESEDDISIMRCNRWYLNGSPAELSRPERIMFFVTEPVGGTITYYGVKVYDWAWATPASGFSGYYLDGVYGDTDLPYTVPQPVMNSGFTFKGWTCSQLGVNTPTLNLVIPQGTTGQLAINLHSDKVYYDVNQSGGYGNIVLFDVYENGTKVATQVNDRTGTVAEGSVVEIKNLTVPAGYTTDKTSYTLTTTDFYCQTIDIKVSRV